MGVFDEGVNWGELLVSAPVLCRGDRASLWGWVIGSGVGIGTPRPRGIWGVSGGESLAPGGEGSGEGEKEPVGPRSGAGQTAGLRGCEPVRPVGAGARPKCGGLRDRGDGDVTGDRDTPGLRQRGCV